MEASELKLGNLVTIDNEESWSELKGKVMSVVSINYNTDLKIFPKSSHHFGLIDIEHLYKKEYNQFIEFLQPIPLTEEWLVKFGWEKSGEWFYMDYYEMNLNGIFNPSDAHYTIHNDIKYVHQLQNLYFALTGEELKIK